MPGSNGIAENVKRTIAQKRTAGESWAKIAESYGLKKATVYRFFCRDYEPKDNAIRVKLGLPILHPAPTCPTCGKVPLAKRCPVCHARPKRTPAERQAARAERERKQAWAYMRKWNG